MSPDFLKFFLDLSCDKMCSQLCTVLVLCEVTNTKQRTRNFQLKLWKKIVVSCALRVFVTLKMRQSVRVFEVSVAANIPRNPELAGYQTIEKQPKSTRTEIIFNRPRTVARFPVSTSSNRLCTLQCFTSRSTVFTLLSKQVLKKKDLQC